MTTMLSRCLRSGAVLLAALLAGCATVPETRTGSEADPWQPMNRGLYAVHDVVDTIVMKPAVTIYKAVTPQILRTGVSNFFNNLEDVVSAANDILQGKGQKAGDDLGRVLLNTGFGLGGLIDIASEAGIERGNEDFGQTFAVWGLPQGPYLFIPIIGPSTVRDGTGLIVRAYTGPLGYIPDVPTRNILYGVGFLDLRYQAEGALGVVDTAAIDRYTFIRNAYLQRRRYLIFDGKVPPEAEEKQ